MTIHHTHQLAILGEILIHSRHAKHLTTAELASHLNRPESFVIEYESGEYRLDLPELVDIADALGIDIVELVNLYQQRIWLSTARS
ncbi:XRE family transcriptional regulator [Pandoraea aquatica]|uniref:XRE family transcriptional regulator n=1 Tax=Pandoraea aquatica TaxID=2508290 RepID=A0A5E4V3K5_9BURK|nr:helix-turn-helix transcriptional regulator [Pandoraea aquatica]VVE06194.1 XRE family transcriptional regulator [Pandoraea aquatica]